QHGQPVTEEDLFGVVQKEIKQRHDSVDQFRKGGREDLVAKEEAEIGVLEAYLPAQLSRDGIAEHVRGLIAEVGSDFKAVMPRAARELKGRGGGRRGNEVVRGRSLSASARSSGRALPQSQEAGYAAIGRDPRDGARRVRLHDQLAARRPRSR